MMSWEEISNLLLRTLRLYHDPVAIFFLKSQEEFQPESYPKRKLSICQYLAHVREVGESLLLTPEGLHCQTAAFVVGFPFKEKNVKASLYKFLQTEAAERLYQERARLPEGAFAGFGFAPLAKAYRQPELVFFVVDALQASHLLDFYLYASGKAEVSFPHYPNAAVCGTMVKAYLEDRPLLALPCPGAFSSGKMDRGELLLVFPWSAFEITVELLRKKAQEGQVSFLGGPRLVGEDICRNCPLISFRKA